MAVRFINPIETPYESQFVPMPLDFMYKNLQEKQAGLDAARDLANKATFTIEGPPWYEQYGVVQKYRDYFSQKVQELTAQLERDKSNYGQVVSQLADLNREYLNNPELNRIRQHLAAYNQNIVPSLQKEGVDQAFFRTKKYNPETGSWDWKRPEEIEIADIVAPIFNDLEKTISDELLPNLQASLTTVFGDGNVYLDELSGELIRKEGDKIVIEDLNLDNPYIRDAISEYAKRFFEGTSPQATYFREFLRGDFKKAEEFILGVAKKKFFRKQNITPGQGTPIKPPKSVGGGSGSTFEPPNANFTRISIGAQNSYNELQTSVNDAQENAKAATTKTRETLGQTLELIESNRNTYSGFIRIFQKFDDRIDQSINAALSKLDPETRSNIERQYPGILESPVTLLEILINPESGGFSRKNGILSTFLQPEQIEKLEEDFYSEVLQLQPESQDEKFALDNLVSSINEMNSSRRVADNLQVIYDEATQEIAEKENLNPENLRREAAILNNMNKYFPVSGLFQNRITYSAEEVNSNPELLELFQLGYIYPIVDLPRSLKEQRYGVIRKNDGLMTTDIIPGNEFLLADGEINTDLVRTESTLQKVAEVYNEKVAEERRLIYDSDTRLNDSSSFTRKLQERYMELVTGNPAALVEMAQRTAYKKGGGKSYLNNQSLQEIFGSENNPFKKPGFRPDKPFEATSVKFHETNLGVPSMLLTVANDPKDPNTFSSMEVNLTDLSPEEQALMITEFISSNIKPVQEVGYSWFAVNKFSSDQLSIPSVYFNSSLPKQKKETKPVFFTDKSGITYSLQTRSTGQTVLSAYDSNNNPIAIDEIRLENGTIINPTNIKSYTELMSYIGAFALNYKGSPGGTFMGKPKSPVILGW